jgi:NADPH:quinone reductase
MRSTITKAVLATGYGGPEKLSFIDIPVADVGSEEVRIAVRAAGVNPVDYKRYNGYFGTDPAALPIRVGLEAAGVVTAVGSDAIGPAGPIAVGDEVVAFRAPGAYAGEIVVPAPAVLPKPSQLSWEQAGGLFLAGTTAVHTLEAVALQKGETVLIHGATGGVGHLAVQLAVARGARVIGTSSAGKHEWLRELGALPVTYGLGLADRIRAIAPAGIDAAIDLVGTNEAIDVSLELVSNRSRIATIAGFARGKQAGVKLLGHAPGCDPGDEIRFGARAPLLAAAAAGRLKILVQSLPLMQAEEAHRLLAAGHTSGKIVLIP